MQLKGVDFNIVVWDNNSTDEEKKLLAQATSDNMKVEVVWHQENIGFTKACNRMMERYLNSKNAPEYLALLNNDTVVHPNWLTELVRTADNTRAGIVSSRMIQYYNRQRIDNLGHMLLSNGEILPIGYNEDLKFTTTTNIGASGGAAFYSTKMIKEIGLFDEFFDTGYEDAEYGLRAYNLGFKLVHSDHAFVFHKGGASIKKVFNEERAIKEQINISYTIRKNYQSYIYQDLLNISRQIYLTPILLLNGNWRTIKVLRSAKRRSRNLNKKSTKRLEFYKNKNKISKSTILQDFKRFRRIVLKRDINYIEKY